ncbi:hypothetical protein ACFWVC_27025 [Streptomyces sp. NPDC058691]|uniref:hypothetical protein n=1 Tax=Streptomyces sp. NPDC058691 TaxID=3346601 RepID=UPI003666E03A
MPKKQVIRPLTKAPCSPSRGLRHVTGPPRKQRLHPPHQTDRQDPGIRTHIATTTLLLAATAATLTGCSTAEGTKATAPSEPTLSQADRDKALADAGIPPVAAGARRAALLAALQAVNPGIVKDPDKAIDAARNQYSAINSGSDRADWAAGQRFTYQGNEVPEAQGKAINEALKALKFCNA